MTIGIDIDDVITSTIELVAEYAKKHFGSNDSELIRKILHSKTIEGNLLTFYKKYLIEMMENYQLKENSKEVIDRLKDKGYKIILITARGYTPQEGIRETTTNYLSNNDIYYDEIVFGAMDKSIICKEKNIDILIDDSIDNLESIRDTKTTPILFNSEINQSIDTDFTRVFNWLELEKYIENFISKTKNNIKQD